MDSQDRRHAPRPNQRSNLDIAQSLQQHMGSQQTGTTGSRLQQHSEESWIEIGSRPSSSSLSSTNEEIITTGLRIQHDSNYHRRRRRTRSAGQFVIGTGHRTTSAGGGSSQEEYEESESESDRVMTSSNEGIRPSPLQQELRRQYSVTSSETMSEGEDEDDDENATTVNYPRSSRRQFEPRPNAFSHPPTVQAPATQPSASYNSRRPAARPPMQRHSYPQHSPYTAISPNTQADHDEALRASLSTLLSAAAAVRGLPKQGQPRVSPGNVSNRVEPATLRLVPESVVLGGATEDASSTHDPSQYASSPRNTSSSPSEKAKRNVSTRSSSKERRTAKKARKVGPLVDEISPTFLTWVVSAGVLVAVSALSFSAGYVIGKETGHAEALGHLGPVGEAGRCSKEAASELGRTGLGLRRLRWTGGSGVRV